MGIEIGFICWGRRGRTRSEYRGGLRVKLKVRDGRRGSDVCFCYESGGRVVYVFTRGINREKWQ